MNPTDEMNEQGWDRLRTAFSRQMNVVLVVEAAELVDAIEKQFEVWMDEEEQ